MRDYGCPVATMTIVPGDEIDINAVKPRTIKTYPDGSYDVRVDPVSYAFMMSSTGKEYVPVDYAKEQLNEFLDQQEAKEAEKGGNSE